MLKNGHGTKHWIWYTIVSFLHEVKLKMLILMFSKHQIRPQFLKTSKVWTQNWKKKKKKEIEMSLIGILQLKEECLLHEMAKKSKYIRIMAFRQLNCNLSHWHKYNPLFPFQVEKTIDLIIFFDGKAFIWVFDRLHVSNLASPNQYNLIGIPTNVTYAYIFWYIGNRWMTTQSEKNHMYSLND